VLSGYAIARQNCFRCHGRTDEGGTKSGTSWEQVARIAADDPRHFDAYVRNPKALYPQSEMAPSPQYDAATLAALRAYFSLFAREGTP
jgi:mono/diheme cytochrome c family protein